MSADKRDSMTVQGEIDFGQRAAWFVENAHPGPHKSKRIAQRFGISPSMAKLLRNGKGWTVARLEQAHRIFGHEFREMVFGPSTGQGGVVTDASSQLTAIVRRELRTALASMLAGSLGPRGAAVAADARGADRRMAAVGTSAADERGGEAATPDPDQLAFDF